MSRGYRGRAAPIGRPRLPGGTHGRIRGPQRHRRAGKTWPELLALAFGAIYLLIGIIGFFITGFDNFFGNENGMPAHHEGETLLGFMINPVHNVVHILIGVAGLVLARTLAGARTYGWLLAVGYGAASIYGLIAVSEDWDFLNLNAVDSRRTV